MKYIRHFLVRIYRGFLYNISDLFSSIQVFFGFEPSLIKTSYSALLQWKMGVSQSDKRKNMKIAIAAIRNYTWIEFAVFAAHYLYKMGCNVLVIYSEKEIEKLYKNKRILEKFGMNFWTEFMKCEYIEKIKIEQQITEDRTSNDDIKDVIDKLANTIAAYNLRVEEYEEDVEPENYAIELDRCKKMLFKTIPSISGILKENQVERILCPSGLIDKSVAFLEATKQIDMTAIFIEGWAWRPGHLIWSFNQPALNYDIKGWIEAIGGWNDTMESDSKEFIQFQECQEVSHDDWLKNFHRVQRSKKISELPQELKYFIKRKGPKFFMGLNVVGDSATLNRQSIYKNQKEWLQHVITYFKKNHNYNLIIRAHPDEVWAKAKVKLGDFALKYAKDSSNIYVVMGDENINTYSILDHIDIGLIWLSNIGIDIIIRGKPIILAARSNYANTGIAEYPQTKNEYFSAIDKYAKNLIKPTSNEIKLAKLYQRIVFKEMSLEATGKRFNAVEYRLGNNRMHPDQEKFYKIIIGELDPKGNAING
ncbi:MAG: hypothetical protein ACOY90_09130 [Candidatus Zhuqueibacterota bacterium]